MDDETRQILVEHFFHAKTMSDIAVARDVSQPTVSRRVEAGLERLRDKLRTRGIFVAGAALSGLLVENAAQAAPAGVLAELGKMAMVGGVSSAAAVGAAGAGTAKAIAVSVVTGAKAKVIVAAAVVIAGAGGVITYNHIAHKGKDNANPPAAAVSAVQPTRSTPSVQSTGGTGSVDTAAMSDEEFEKWLFGQGLDEETAAEPQVAATTSGEGGFAEVPVATDTSTAYGAGFGGMMMGSIFTPDFSAPDRTVSSFMHLLPTGDIDAMAQCFVEGSSDAEAMRASSPTRQTSRRRR